MIKYEVGAPYPGNYRKQDCGVIGVFGDGGIGVVITFADIKDVEVSAFKTAFRYGLFIDDKAFPVIIWVWDFPSPINKLETPFNLQAEPVKTQEAFLAEEKNLWTFFLVDWKSGILRAMKTKSLDQDLIAKMHETTRLQLTAQGSFDESLNTIYRVFPDSLWNKCEKGKL